jgi:hypothetical protein
MVMEQGCDQLWKQVATSRWGFRSIAVVGRGGRRCGRTEDQCPSQGATGLALQLQEEQREPVTALDRSAGDHCCTVGPPAGQACLWRSSGCCPPGSARALCASAACQCWHTVCICATRLVVWVVVNCHMDTATSCGSRLSARNCAAAAARCVDGRNDCHNWHSRVCFVVKQVYPCVQTWMGCLCWFCSSRCSQQCRTWQGCCDLEAASC